MDAEIIHTLTINILPVVFAITLHEAAHGWVAHRLGDDTAWRMGRVTLNPLPHIDPVGTLLLPLLLYIGTAGHMLFGYAKPVPVQFSRLHNPKRDMIWVALAGPGINLIQALLWAVLDYALLIAGVDEPFLLRMAEAGVLVNAVMFAFNLFPLPPLDGGRILVGLLPWRAAMAVSRIEPWGFYIVLALVVMGVINAIWMQPLMGLTYDVLRWVLQPLQTLLSTTHSTL